jgi:hypothetical protein
MDSFNGPEGPRERIVKRSSVVVSICALVTLSGLLYAAPGVAEAPVSAVKGSMVIAANGARLAPVYRVAPDGAAQIILEGKMVTIPATTLSMADGHLVTSLTKSEVLALH